MAILPRSLSWLLFTSIASAQSLISSLSFGHQSPISQGGSVPGWQLSSVNHEIQFLSDRMILTPPVPGNTKGALWSENTAPSEIWTAELAFRASGQPTGTGNLQLWYIKDKDSVGVNSVYSVETFDGFALVIDQYGGKGGSIRGFLNDGGQNFRTHANLEALAFGHCDYSYRNLGRQSNIKISNQNGLTVSVDDRVCFSTDKMALPAGYHFGLSSSTADSPDSFEIFHLTVSSGGSNSPPVQQQQNVEKGPPPPQLQKLDNFPGSPEAVPDSNPDDIKSQADQFADLHNRMQGLTHQIANMFAEFSAISSKIDQRHWELAGSIKDIQGSKDTGLPPETVATIRVLGQKVEAMETTLQTIRREVEGKDYREQLEKLNAAVERVQGGLAEHLPERIGSLITSSAPRMGTFVFIIVAVQIMMVGAYIVYKRRRNSMPKKYL